MSKLPQTLEASTGTSLERDSWQAGRGAAQSAIDSITTLDLSLVLVFATSSHDPDQITAGVASVTGDTPMAGSSGGGVICGTSASEAVVVTVLASPHLRAEVRAGTEVSKDWEKATLGALPMGNCATLFGDEPRVGRPHYFAHPSSGLSPLLVLLFAPGMTVDAPSRAHEIHSFLRRRTLGRIPIVGGSSGCADFAHGNFQISNGHAYRDTVVIAAVECDLRFGVGVAHGFRPTRKRAVVTRAEGHTVFELNDKPAGPVCADLLEMDLDELRHDPIWFGRQPFGVADAYGGHHLLVPEKVLAGDAVQFGPVVGETAAITLMEIDRERQLAVYRDAFEQAKAIGKVQQPSLTLLFSCFLRYRVGEQAAESEAEGLRQLGHSQTNVSGFLTFGEYGITNEGLPIYCNQSVVALVFGREVDPSAAGIRQAADTLTQVEEALHRRTAELDAIRDASQVRFDSHCWQQGVESYRGLMLRLTGAEHAVVRLRSRGLDQVIPPEPPSPGKYTPIALSLDSMGESFGQVELWGGLKLESLPVAQSMARLLAQRLHRVYLQRTVQEQSREFETLHNMAHGILTASDYRSVLRAMAQQIQDHVGGDAYLLLIHWEEAGLVREEASVESYSERAGSLAHRALASGVVEHLSDHESHLMAVPLAVQDRANGVLVLRLPGGQHIGDRGQSFLSLLTVLLAVMVELYVWYRGSHVVREIHHRVKNNLQIIASLLSLQQRRLEDPAAREALTMSIRRIMSIAVVHETLSAKHSGQVDALEVLRTIAKLVVDGMVDTGQEIVVCVEEGPPVFLNSYQTTNLAVIANELLGNAFKHGLRSSPRGEIHVRLTQDNHETSLWVTDDGKGLEAGFDLSKKKGLGLQLVNTIAENDLRGRFTLEPANPGVQACLRIPVAVPTALEGDS